MQAAQMNDSVTGLKSSALLPFSRSSKLDFDKAVKVGDKEEVVERFDLVLDQ